MPHNFHHAISPQKELFRILLIWLGIPVLLITVVFFTYNGAFIRQEYMAKSKAEISATARWTRDILCGRIDTACLALSRFFILMPLANQDGRITISTDQAEDGGVFLCVQDTGFEIAKENLPKIFATFFTTKDPGKGSEPGLPTCHGILQRLGGIISMKSQAGQGSTVTILLLPREARSRQQEFEESQA